MGIFSFLKKKKVEEKSEFGYYRPYDISVATGIRNKQTTPYQVTIENTTKETKKAVLFGYNRHSRHENYGSDEGIIVTPSQSNVEYGQLIIEVSQNPIKTNLIRVQSNNTSQVTQKWTVQSSKATGHEVTMPVVSKSYFSAMQFQANIIDVPIELHISGREEISLDVLSETKVTFTFFFDSEEQKQLDFLLQTLERLGINGSIIKQIIERNERRERRKALWSKFVDAITFKKLRTKKPKKVAPKKMEFEEDINNDDFGKFGLPTLERVKEMRADVEKYNSENESQTESTPNAEEDTESKAYEEREREEHAEQGWTEPQTESASEGESSNASETTDPNSQKGENA